MMYHALGRIALFALLSQPLGCSDNSKTADSGPTEAGVCSTNSCSGCCENMSCRSGQSPEACGTAGLTCIRCKATEVCSTGRCVPSESKCKPAECPGCCQGDSCEAGNRDEACGKKGEPCSRCGSTQLCLDGSCRCNTATCPGCCQDDVCINGGDRLACGRRGEDCRKCSPDEICDGGGCTPGIDCGDCPDGCCDGETCREGTSTDQCGGGGLPCRACKTGELCAQGVCNDPSKCGAGLCTGCCADSTCQDGVDPTACGAGGGLCRRCEATEICKEGSCIFDPDSIWAIIVHSATIDPALGTWDPLINTAPDVYIEVAVGSISTSSTVVDNTYQPQWNQLIGTAVAKEILAVGLKVTIKDADPVGGDEIIGACTLEVTEEVLLSGAGFADSCPHPDGKNYVTRLDLSFAPANK